MDMYNFALSTVGSQHFKCEALQAVVKQTTTPEILDLRASQGVMYVVTALPSTIPAHLTKLSFTTLGKRVRLTSSGAESE